MNENRKSALIVGFLFIIATLFFVIGQSIHGPVTDSPDFLQNAYPNRFVIIGGILVELVAILSIPLIAVYILPILRNHVQGLSVAYVVFRSIEAMLLIGVSIYTLSMISVSESYLGAAGPGTDLLQEIGATSQAISASTFLLAVGLIFPITALMLNAVLYRSRLVPRIISAWGFIAATILLTGTVLHQFDLFAGVPESTLEAILTIPIAVQEMVFALWLIFRGFNPDAVGEISGQ